MSAYNPFDVLPPKARAAVYAILWLAALVLAAFQASDGDWLQMAIYILGALGFMQAQAKVDKG